MFISVSVGQQKLLRNLPYYVTSLFVNFLLALLNELDILAYGETCVIGSNSAQADDYLCLRCAY